MSHLPKVFHLSHRQQQVLIGQSLSRLNKVNASVPQGSVLRPLLFLCYVNDITENLVSIARLLTSSDLEGILNHDLYVISKWSKQWLVSFNPSKTEVFHYGNGTPPNLVFENTIIIPTDCHKHLGVTLNSNCKWSTHINNIISSSSKTTWHFTKN